MRRFSIRLLFASLSDKAVGPNRSLLTLRVFLLLYFILCSVIVAMRCVIVSINHYLSIYLSSSILLMYEIEHPSI